MYNMRQGGSTGDDFQGKGQLDILPVVQGVGVSGRNSNHNRAGRTALAGGVK